MSRLRAPGISLALALASVALPIRAQDLIHPSLGDSALSAPAIPETWVTTQRGSLTLSYPRALEPVVRTANVHAASDASAVSYQLGLTTVPRWSVRFVSDANDLRHWAPAAMPPPEYAVGVAYPSVGLALVATRAPTTYAAVELRQVLRHELSHLALYAATGGNPLPRWFTEGLAVEQAGEHSIERFQQLAVASYSGGVLPWSRLDAGFSGRHGDVNVAYAQSADVVAWMIRSEGRSRFLVLLNHLRGGRTFDQAIGDTYGVGPAAFEARWREEFHNRFALAPLWAGTGIVTLLGLVTVIIAMVRRKKKSRATLARWEREDRVRHQRVLRWFALAAHRPSDPPHTLH